MIDPAILRAGRLDKKYYIGVPDFEARMALFKLYLENVLMIWIRLFPIS